MTKNSITFVFIGVMMAGNALPALADSVQSKRSSNIRNHASVGVRTFDSADLEMEEDICDMFRIAIDAAIDARNAVVGAARAVRDAAEQAAAAVRDLALSLTNDPSIQTQIWEAYQSAVTVIDNAFIAAQQAADEVYAAARAVAELLRALCKVGYYLLS